MRLGFKQTYIEPILSGEKTDTIRKDTRLVAGDIVLARCRYDQPPFATLRVLSVRTVTLAEMDPERAAGVAAMYPGTRQFACIAFECLEAKKKRAQTTV